MANHEVPVGFIGLGKMGVPMVRKLLEHGFEVLVANRSQESVEILASEGAVAAASVAEVTERAEVIMLALPDEPSVRDVISQILASAHQGQVVIEHSTISPGLAKSTAAELSEKGVAYLDAPVSGGPAGAERGALTVMVGGDSKDLARVTPILAAFGDPIRHCGPVGAGQAIKLVNQLLVGIHTSASAEAAAFGHEMGIEYETIAEVIGTSFGSSAMLARNLPRFDSADYSPATPVSLIKKDLSLIQRESEALAVPLRLGGVAQELFEEASESGLAGNDMAAVYELWSRGHES